MLWPNPVDPDLAFLHARAAELRQLIEHFSQQRAEIIRLGEDDYWARVNAAANVKALFHIAKRHRIDDAFLFVLQSFDMVPRDRKVIEKAAMLLSRSHKRAPAPAQAVVTYLKTLLEYELYSRTLDRVLDSGRLHQGGPTSGTFTLINAGGFSTKVMDSVVARVADASKLLSAKGLDRVLYGDVHVVNTIRRSARVLAFYTVNDDGLFIRANVPKASHDSGVDAVVHELAHRLHFKFLRQEMNPGQSFPSILWAPNSAADRALFDVYQRLKTKDVQKILDYEPVVGDTVESKGVTFEVVGRKGQQILFRGPEGIKARLPIEAYMQMKGEPSVFISPYARTAYQENFAEMVRAYCRDALPADQVQMLRGVIG